MTRLLCLRLHARPSGATLDHRHTAMTGHPFRVATVASGEGSSGRCCTHPQIGSKGCALGGSRAEPCLPSLPGFSAPQTDMRSLGLKPCGPNTPQLAAGIFIDIYNAPSGRSARASLRATPAKDDLGACSGDAQDQIPSNSLLPVQRPRTASSALPRGHRPAVGLAEPSLRRRRRRRPRSRVQQRPRHPALDHIQRPECVRRDAHNGGSVDRVGSKSRSLGLRGEGVGVLVIIADGIHLGSVIVHDLSRSPFVDEVTSCCDLPGSEKRCPRFGRLSGLQHDCLTQRVMASTSQLLRSWSFSISLAEGTAKNLPPSPLLQRWQASTRFQTPSASGMIPRSLRTHGKK